jgi:hypothetical protein
MSELLKNFDITTIILVVFMTAFAIREVFELYHYFHDKIYGRYEK